MVTHTITIPTTSVWTGQRNTAFGMSVLGRVRGSVCAFPIPMGVPSAVDAASKDLFEGPAVRGYDHTVAAVSTGAFPGASAWSPPSE